MLDEHVQNSLRQALRVITILAAITTVFTMYELTATWFAGSSARVGAAIGFGSSQTINNISAGFYVIVSRPLRQRWDAIRTGRGENGKSLSVTT